MTQNPKRMLMVRAGKPALRSLQILQRENDPEVYLDTAGATLQNENTWAYLLKMGTYDVARSAKDTSSHPNAALPLSGYDDVSMSSGAIQYNNPLIGSMEEPLNVTITGTVAQMINDRAAIIGNEDIHLPWLPGIIRWMLYTTLRSSNRFQRLPDTETRSKMDTPEARVRQDRRPGKKTTHGNESQDEEKEVFRSSVRASHLVVASW
ncbi:hypothetical protein V8B97DRAFT_1919793 [Scleroderma yunnanense]